jgi:hypothetical protein
MAKFLSGADRPIITARGFDREANMRADAAEIAANAAKRGAALFEGWQRALMRFTMAPQQQWCIVAAGAGKSALGSLSSPGI